MMMVYDGPLAGQQGHTSYLTIIFRLGSLVVSGATSFSQVWLRDGVSGVTQA
jgi:hypothetical protein